MLNAFFHVRQSVIMSLLSPIVFGSVSSGNWQIVVLIVRYHTLYLDTDPNSGAADCVVFGPWFVRTSPET